MYLYGLSGLSLLIAFTVPSAFCPLSSAYPACPVKFLPRGMLALLNSAMRTPCGGFHRACIFHWGEDYLTGVGRNYRTGVKFLPR
jgi:hypothetical protein